MPKPKPYSIKMFLPVGDPDGLRIIEKSNWTGEGIVFARAGFEEDHKKRKEFQRTGVYVLVGQDDTSSLPQVYIGEGESVDARLTSHFAKKDFWTWGIFFVTKDNSLNKAHVKFLESRLIELAAKAKRCNLTNCAEPTKPSLSEADTADMDCFLDDMLSIFPLVGLSIFEQPPRRPCTVSKLLYIESKGIKVKGCESNKGFIVLAGSEAVLKTVPSYPESFAKLRDELSKKGVMVRKGDLYVFADDYLFSSPSTASSIVLGRNSNGRTSWRNKEGKTLKELQEAVASASVND
ncbi:GIY-YIG nuclease family protein [Desulfobaculum bizertense]|uniref:DUF4357 domain-containing protein n=1 Tax=Desulfobaculum bizertense DSM 18034 TaxID=1121442 RepID=A0A1T4W0Y5_9BACT|nr:GIY-YIG nuclease family protein [Desulfobaculum bizertense]SKA70893.1 protein of unknown function [Desulfobaculum bizertense DSM 18034]